MRATQKVVGTAIAMVGIAVFLAGISCVGFTMEFAGIGLLAFGSREK